MRKDILGALGAVLLVACGDDDDASTTFDAPVTPMFDARPPDANSSPDANTTPDAPTTKPCTTNLTATGDVTAATQTALIGATPGAVICFADGTYNFTEELSLTVNGVTLRGNVGDRTKVIFDFTNQAAGNANAIHAQGVTDFTIEGMEIRDSAGDGIRITNGTNIKVRKLNVIWTSGRARGAGAYGIYPVECHNTLIDDVEVRGASDAGIYVGQSTVAVVRNSRAEGNVAGLEIENTDDAEVVGNVTVGNTGGMLVFANPNLVRKSGINLKVHGNTIENNNLETFAEGGTVAFLPQGTGLLMFSTKNVEIHDNTIRSNDSMAIALVSCPTVQIITFGSVMCNDPLFDGFSEDVYVHDNIISGNGDNPHTPIDLLAMGTKKDPFFDIVWDGVVDATKPANPDNKICVKNNGNATYAKVDVPSLGATYSTDTAEVDCTHPAVPGVDVTW